MALLKILKFPDPRLRIQAKPVSEIDGHIRQIVSDMYETMYAANGVGLAATQVGISLRIFTMDVSEAQNQKICAINPEIITQEGDQESQEGCLSVTGAYDKVIRRATVHLRALNIHGEPFELHGEKLMAACIQHEVDHLNGILFIHHLSRLKQERIRNKIEKLNRRVSE